MGQHRQAQNPGIFEGIVGGASRQRNKGFPQHPVGIHRFAGSAWAGRYSAAIIGTAARRWIGGGVGIGVGETVGVAVGAGLVAVAVAVGYA